MNFSDSLKTRIICSHHLYFVDFFIDTLCWILLLQYLIIKISKYSVFLFFYLVRRDFLNSYTIVSSVCKITSQIIKCHEKKNKKSIPVEILFLNVNKTKKKYTDSRRPLTSSESRSSLKMLNVISETSTVSIETINTSWATFNIQILHIH